MRTHSPARRFLMSFGIAIAAAIPSSGSCTQAPGPSDLFFPSNEDLELMLRYLAEDGASDAIVLGVLEADGSTRIVSYGDPGPGTRPLGPLTGFEIGSMNKSFTGTLLAYAVARGEVALDDPISLYLPDGVGSPSFDGREITLLDLATHRSSLPRNPPNRIPTDERNPYADYTVEMLYDFLSTYALARAPGSVAVYSNAGFAVLGHLLGVAAGMDFRDLVHERILDPLGMSMTAFSREGRDNVMADWMARGYDAEGEPTSYYDLTEAFAGAGGLNSNAEDLLRYLAANMGPAETELERAMRDAHQVRSPVQGNLFMGLGWQVVRQGDLTIVNHGGGTGGFSTMLAFDPDRRVGFVRLTNRQDFSDAEEFDLNLLRFGPAESSPEVSVPEEVLRDREGEYELAPAISAVVALEEEGWLTIRLPGRVRSRMYAESPMAFHTKDYPYGLSFTAGAAGRIDALTLEVGGETRTATRLEPGRSSDPAAVEAAVGVWELSSAAFGAQARILTINSATEGSYGSPAGVVPVTNLLILPELVQFSTRVGGTAYGYRLVIEGNRLTGLLYGDTGDVVAQLTGVRR